MNGALGVLNVGVNVDMRQFNTGMQQIDQRAAQTTSNLNKLGGALTTGAGIGVGIAVATTALGALSSAATGAVSSVIGLNSQLEQARIGFTALFQSGDKANAFIKQLQTLAATTTFEFPSLLQASRQLTGMGVAGEQVIPILKMVAGAVMAVGGGDVEIRRVNLALTQMMAAGKVNAQDMNQLAQAGIPAWKMLAESMGMSIGQVRELSHQGQITAAQLIKAFDDFSKSHNMDQIFEQSAKTWQAAASNIIDGLRNLGAEGFEPLFNLVRDGAVGVAEALTSMDAQNLAQDIKATMVDIVSSMEPVRASIQRAFEAFKTDGISGAVRSILTDMQNLAKEMVGAGYNVVASFASGIMSGGAALITEAANFVADLIANYLIGQSPPSTGPLAAIEQGGTNLMAAYAQGMRGGLGDIVGVAQAVSDAFGNVSKSMTLAQGEQAFKSAGTNMEALKNAASDAEGVLRNLDRLIRDNEMSTKDLSNAATDIKDAYEGAISPLEAQVRALRETNDLAQKYADIQDKVKNAQLRQALITAQGDPVKRAQLTMQIDALEEREKEVGIAKRQADIERQISEQHAKKEEAKKAGKPFDEKSYALQIQALELDRQQAGLQAQLTGMVDKEAVARIKAQQAALTQTTEQRHLNQEVASLNREIAAAPLEAQIRDLKAQEQALLEPLEARIKAQKREHEQLQATRQQWQMLGSDIKDAIQQQSALAADAKRHATEATKSAKEAALANPMDLSTIIKPEAITAVATKVGESFVKGLGASIQAMMPRLIGGAIGAMLGGAAFGPLGAIAGAAFGGQFVTRLLERLGSLENIGGLIAGKISDALNIDTGGANNSIEAFAIIFETMRDRALIALEALRTGAIAKIGGIQESLAGARGKLQEVFGEGASTSFIDGISSALESLKKLLQGDIPGAVDSLKESFNSFGISGSQSIDNINSSIETLKGHLEPLVPVVAGVATAFAVFKTLTTVAAIVAGIGAAFGTASAFITTSGGVIGAIIALLGGPLTVAILAISVIIGTLTAAWIGNWGDIQGITATAIAAVQVGFDTLVTFIGTSWETIKASTITAWASIQAGFTTGVETVQGLWQAGWTAIGDIQTAAWNLLTPENQARIVELQRLTGELWTVLGQLWTVGTEALFTTLSTWGTNIQTNVAAMYETLKTLSDTGWKAIQAIWDVVLEAIKLILGKHYDDLVAFTTKFFTDVKKLWDDNSTILAETATALGVAIMGALVGAINEKVAVVVDAVIGAVRKALEGARSLLTTFGANAGGNATNMSNVVGGSKADPQLQAIINAAAGRHRLDPAMFTAQLQHESAGFDPRVLTGARRGGAGEVGIGQFLESTLKPRLAKAGISLDQYLGDVNIQVEEAAKYLEELVAEYGNIDKALQAYNGGPGGVGSGATQNYVNIIRDIATNLQTQNVSGAQLMSGGGSGMFQQMNTKISQITAGANAGLSPQAAAAACGPYAATLFQQAVGRMPNLAEATKLASMVGWTQQAGMGGTGNFMQLLGNMGLNAVRQQATASNVNAALGAGNPIAISTPKHYFVGQGGTAGGGINVGATGTVLGGKPVMTLAEIEALGGGLNDLIVLIGELNGKGTETFNNLTHVSGQMGTAIEDSVTGATAANEQFAAANVTLAQSIQNGVVPAGLAARDAIGAMAIGIQPLISKFANGEITVDELGKSIVKLASDTHLTDAPLQGLESGVLSTDAALAQVLGSLAEVDPAFAEIRTSFEGASASSTELADVLLQGLGNVTGTVSTGLAAMAQGAQPLLEAFAAGSITSDQFVQSVVSLAATTGLAQQPLRAMQDGMMTTNEAIAAVVTQVGQADPAIASLATNFADANAPTAELTASFLTWLATLTQATTANQEAADSVQVIPEALVALEQPMADASTTVMTTLPEATTIALTASVDAIRAIGPDAASAATEVGQAIIEALAAAVIEGAESIADAAMEVVKNALEAAKKAAEEATKNLESKTDGEGSSSKKDNVEARARGGMLSSGVWTLVGENGPELISPSGYVYTAGETMNMIVEGMAEGLINLERFASGGASKTKTKAKPKSKPKKSKPKDEGDGEGSNQTPKRVTTPQTREELDLEQQILTITQKRDELLLKMLPTQQALAAAERAQELAGKGTVEDQLALAGMKLEQLQLDQQIHNLMYNARPSGRTTDSAATMEMEKSTYEIELDLKHVKEEQEKASKGSLTTQLRRNELVQQQNALELAIKQTIIDSIGARDKVAEIDRAIAALQKGNIADQQDSAILSSRIADNNAKIAHWQAVSLPLRQKQRDIDELIASANKGTVADQQDQAILTAKIASNNAEIAMWQRQSASLRNTAAEIERAIQDATKGTIENQQNAAILTKLIADNEFKIANIQAEALPIRHSIAELEADIAKTQRGSLADQQTTLKLNTDILKNNMEINRLNQLAAPLHKQIADQERVVADLQRGTLDNRKQLAALDMQRAELAVTGAQAEASAVPLRNKIAQIEKQIEESLKGNAAQRAIIHANERDLLGLTSQELEQQRLMLPIQVAIRTTQAELERIQKGTLSDQIHAVDVSTQLAGLRIQELQAQGKLRDVEAGSLKLSQAQINALHVQLEQIDNQRSQVQQVTEEQQLQAQITGADAQKRLLTLQDEAKGHQDVLDLIGDRKAVLDNQNAIIQNGNEIATTGLQDQLGTLQDQLRVHEDTLEEVQAQTALIDAQANLIKAASGIDLVAAQGKLTALQDQLEVYNVQIEGIQAQNDIMDLQLESIQSSNSLRSVGLQEQLLSMQDQLVTYDEQIARIQTENDTFAAQQTIITTMNEARAAALLLEKVQVDAQLKVYDDMITKIGDQNAVLQTQHDFITAINADRAAALGLEKVQIDAQLAVYDDIITKLGDQNGIYEAQKLVIDTANLSRAAALGLEKVQADAMLKVYDDQVLKLQAVNDKIGLQTGFIDAANKVAAGGYDAQIISLGTILDARNKEIEKLKEGKAWLDIQIATINMQNAISAAGHAANIIQLQAQLAANDAIAIDLNAQLGTLNAQKKVYEDIRALADAIANRPANPPSAPTPGGSHSGPPGTVAATATKEGAETLYLSRGSGTDGWYTSSGQLVVTGGSANPPNGYRVRWLAAGGLWHKGEVAVVGEDGPELAIAPRDLMVFPHEKSARMMRSTHAGTVGNDEESGTASTVNHFNIEYHRHDGKDYGAATLERVVMDAVSMAQR